MKGTTVLLLTALMLPMSASAQQEPTERLLHVLPEEIAVEVLARVETARSNRLPADVVASIALEGVAKGRSGAEVLREVELLFGDMTRARDALDRAQGTHGEGEIEAATAAMRMGVDGRAIAELASSRPSGRSLAVPLLVMGGLTQRGLPSDDALVAVQASLRARANDAELVGDFPQVGRDLSRPLSPADIGIALASGFAGFQVPVSGLMVPVRAGAGDGMPIGGVPNGRPGPGGGV